MEWFQRARDRMNIRMPDSTPFHMKVTFQAFPGMELLPENQKSELVTGDGICEETWLAPHKWRREGRGWLTSCRGVGVGAGTGKMQASSEYEPMSRPHATGMRCSDPIPRNLVSRESNTKVHIEFGPSTA